MNEEFKYSIKIRDNEIKVRKWKVKDKLNFLNSLKNLDYEETINSLVYNCLEDKEKVLTVDEFKYVFLKMREINVSPLLEFDMICSECSEMYSFNALIDEVFKINNNEPFKTIVEDDLIIELNELSCSREIYSDIFKMEVSDYEKSYLDFLLHIKSINDNEDFTFETLIEFFNNIDSDIFEKIYEKWEGIKFKLHDEVLVKCPHCEHVELYNIDKIPTFFPDSWF